MATIEFTISTGIFSDLGEPTSVAVSSISGKLVSPFIGRLNYSLTTSYTIVSEAYFDQDLAVDYPALYIYSLMYKQDYYNIQATKLAGSTEIDWTRLEDGDGVVGRADPTNKAKLFKDLARDARNELTVAINFYRQILASPKSIDYLTIENRQFAGWYNQYFPRGIT